jgi:hypothetical protein
MVTNEWVYVYNDFIHEGYMNSFAKTIKTFFGIEGEPHRFRLQTIGFINLLKLSHDYPELSFMISYELFHSNIYEYVYLQNGKIISHIQKDFLNTIKGNTNN